LRALSLCTCCRHCPGAAAGRRRRSSHPAVSAFPDNVVGSACTSSFSRNAQRSLALRPAHSRGHLYVTCYTEGFSHFVTSMTAPVASGWSVWPGGACTHWKAPPCHGAHVKRTLRIAPVDVAFGEGFWTPARCRTVVRARGPAFESLPRRKPRTGRGAVLVGATYGGLRIACGSGVSARWRVARSLAGGTDDGERVRSRGYAGLAQARRSKEH
jgi:hypothetical protein